MDNAAFGGRLDAFNREFVDTTRLEARDALRAIIAAYDKVLEQPGTKIPTMLMCAIEIGRSKL